MNSSGEKPKCARCGNERAHCGVLMLDEYGKIYDSFYCYDCYKWLQSVDRKGGAK